MRVHKVRILTLYVHMPMLGAAACKEGTDLCSRLYAPDGADGVDAMA
jgi:hypothetical protein